MISSALAPLRRHLPLTLEMTRRELVEQFAGQVLGALWAVFHPVFQMALYIFVFSVVFKTRIGGNQEMPLDYTAYILSGLVPWLGCQFVLGKSASLLSSHANLVKQVVFPIEVLPAKVVLASFVPQFIGLAALTGYVLATRGSLFPTYLLLPVLLALQLVALLGIAYLLAAIGAFVRDAKDVVQLFVSAGMYLMPVVYLPNWVPKVFEPVLYLNPFSYLIWCYQDALYFGRFEHPWAWAVLAVGSFASLALGFALFNRVKPHFASVL